MSHLYVLRAAMWQSHRSEGPHRSGVAVTLVTSQRADTRSVCSGLFLFIHTDEPTLQLPRRPFIPRIHYLPRKCCHLHNKLSFDTIDDTTSHRVNFPPESVLLSSRRSKTPLPNPAATRWRRSHYKRIRRELHLFPSAFTFSAIIYFLYYH